LRAFVNFVFGLKKIFLALSIYKDVITHLTAHLVFLFCFLRAADVSIQVKYMLKALAKENMLIAT
jgi:hypothetical protein